MDGRIVFRRDDGTEQDVTELVQIAYDVATHSMDWGSGFLDREETNGLILLAEACEFPSLDEVLQEQWTARMAAGKNYGDLKELAHQRGVTYWHQVQPTPEEREAFMAEIRGS